MILAAVVAAAAVAAAVWWNWPRALMGPERPEEIWMIRLQSGGEDLNVTDRFDPEALRQVLQDYQCVPILSRDGFEDGYEDRFPLQLFFYGGEEAGIWLVIAGPEGAEAHDGTRVWRVKDGQTLLERLLPLMAQPA